MFDFKEILQERSDQSCTAIEMEKELFLYRLKERDFSISGINRVGNSVIIEKSDKQIVLRGDNLVTRKQVLRKVYKNIRGENTNEKNICAYTLMPHIIGDERCQINSKRATTFKYFDNPCFFFEKLRNAYQLDFQIENADNVENWIIKKENILFWEIWGKKDEGYKAYLEDFCLSFLPKLKKDYGALFGENWMNESWDTYKSMLCEFSKKRIEEIKQRYNLIFR
jgi:hypothetical protein